MSLSAATAGCTAELDGGVSGELVIPARPDDSPGGDPPETWRGAVGSWCGPLDDQTLWLVASPAEAACDARATKIYNVPPAPPEPVSTLALQLDPLLLESLPVLLSVPLLHCEGESCLNVQGQLSVESFEQAGSLTGKLAYVLDGSERIADLSAEWCPWDDYLPPHPESERLAQDISLGEVALYQGVKVSLARDGVAVETRNAPVVRSRPALVRVFVQPEAAFEPRELQGRLTLLTTDGAEHRFEQTRLVEAPSNDGDLESTFNFELLPELLDQGVQYRVELREVAACTPTVGTNVDARFPAEGAADLDAEAVGTVRVHLVPIISTTTGELVPNTSEELLDAWRDRVFALYPTTEVQLSVREPMITDINIGDDGFADANAVFDAWGDVLDDLRVLRTEDGAPRDLHYYGLLDPLEAHGAGGLAGQGPTMGGLRTAGTGVGLGRSPNNAGIFAHELGHMHGLDHAPCGAAGAPDPAFPYEDGGIGVWGYDLLSGALFDPAEYADLMGYCNDNWISDFHYDLIAGRAAELNELALMSFAEPQARTPWRTLRIDSQGNVRWGREYLRTSLPEGAPETAWILDELGDVIDSVTVYRITFQHWSGSLLDVPAPRAGWAALHVLGAAPHRFDATR